MTDRPRLEIPPETLTAAARRVMARCDELARVSAETGAITRVYLSSEHAEVNAKVGEWMRDAGMRTWEDAAGNRMGLLEAEDPQAPVLLLGSHLDTVRDAGRYDGILGVLMAIEAVRLLAARTDDDEPRSPFPVGLQVAAFWDEEGTRFGTALLGSSAAAGLWDESWWDLRDQRGITLREAFRSFGLDPARVGEAALRPEHLVGYLEAHIEQGPELDRSGEPLAVVSSIAAARRFRIVVEGEARHAGGTPYDMRRDALLGASEAALAIERICRAQHHVIGTVGQFEAFPGAVNVVPGEARFSLDLRGEIDGERDRVWQQISRDLDTVTRRRHLRWRAQEIHHAAATFCAPLLQDVLREGMATTSERPSAEAPPLLFSPAGHDGMALGRITDVGMLFLRNPGGISHHPDESVSTQDVARGLRAFAEAVAHVGAEPVS